MGRPALPRWLVLVVAVTALVLAGSVAAADSPLATPAKKLHGTFAYCVHSISPNGAPSAQSCSTVTLR